MDAEFVVTASHEAEKVELARRMRREMTPQEARLWECLRRSQLGGLHFRRQQVVHGFIADFYCHRAKLIVEIDGAAHALQADHDAERASRLAARGLHVLRIPNRRVDENIAGVLAEIHAFAQIRLPQRQSPFH